MGILFVSLFVFGILNAFLGAINAEYYTSEKQRKWGYIRMYVGVSMIAVPMMSIVVYSKSIHEALSIFTAFDAGVVIVASISLIALILRSAFTD